MARFKNGYSGNTPSIVDPDNTQVSSVDPDNTFSDGVAADWYLDQMGRFGLVPPTPGYRPAQEDLAEFRILLEQELARQGL